MLKVTFSSQNPSEGVLVMGVYQDRKFTPEGEALDTALGGALLRAMRASYFMGKAEEFLSILGVGPYERVVLFGLGEPGKISEAQAYDMGGLLVSHLLQTPHTSLNFVLKGVPQELLPVWIAFGMTLRCWQFNKYRTQLKAAQTIALQEACFVVPAPDASAKAFLEERSLAESIQFSRTLIAEPPNVIYPKTFMDHIESLKELGLEIEALDQAAMAQLGMGALLGVAQGSDAEPYLGIMRWNGGKEGEAPLAFVGKGVTFDTGGISLKPSLNMDEMKADMAGASVVVGLMRTLAARKAPVNAVGVVALVENMPSGRAQRPGDIVVSMSGQTIEVLNTDAEGRLILADALYYTHNRFKPRYMVDLATLTGAMRIALGSEYAGVFSPDDTLAASLEKAGNQVGERLWRLPLGANYDKELNSQVADIKNIASSGYGAGSILGGQFLARFVGNTPWAHLDIANMDFGAKGSARAPKGPTGFGVCLLNRWVKTLVG